MSYGLRGYGSPASTRMDREGVEAGGVSVAAFDPRPPLNGRSIWHALRSLSLAPARTIRGFLILSSKASRCALTLRDVVFWKRSARRCISTGKGGYNGFYVWLVLFLHLSGGCGKGIRKFYEQIPPLVGQVGALAGRKR